MVDPLPQALFAAGGVDGRSGGNARLGGVDAGSRGPEAPWPVEKVILWIQAPYPSRAWVTIAEPLHALVVIAVTAFFCF